MTKTTTTTTISNTKAEAAAAAAREKREEAAAAKKAAEEAAAAAARKKKEEAAAAKKAAEEAEAQRVKEAAEEAAIVPGTLGIDRHERAVKEKSLSNRLFSAKAPESPSTKFGKKVKPRRFPIPRYKLRGGNHVSKNPGGLPSRWVGRSGKDRGRM